MSLLPVGGWPLALEEKGPEAFMLVVGGSIFRHEELL